MIPGSAPLTVLVASFGRPWQHRRSPSTRLRARFRQSLPATDRAAHLVSPYAHLSTMAAMQQGASVTNHLNEYRKLTISPAKHRIGL